MPMLLIAESDGLNLRAAMECSGETPMFAQLSKSAYCDSVWQYGIPLPEGLSPSCCSAVDAIISYNGQSESHDLCPQSVADLTIEGEMRSGLLCKDKFRPFITRGNLKYEDNAFVKTRVMGGSAERDLSRWL